MLEHREVPASGLCELCLCVLKHLHDDVLSRELQRRAAEVVAHGHVGARGEELLDFGVVVLCRRQQQDDVTRLQAWRCVCVGGGVALSSSDRHL